MLEDELRKAYRYCGDVTKKKAGNFYYAFVFLPPRKKQAIHALYAFCQQGDQIVDEVEPGVDPREALEKFQNDFMDCLDGNYRSPMFVALGDSIERFHLRDYLFFDLISGFEDDISKTRYETFADLEEYCYKVASTVGLLCAKIFGYRNKAVKRYARNLGIAFQLTNILRDIKEDFQRGRIYIPQEDLHRFKYSEEDIGEEIFNSGFRSMMEFQYLRVMDYYRKAVSVLPSKERRNQLAAEIMRAIYMELLETIRWNRYQIYEKRISLNAARKIRLALGAYFNTITLKTESWAY